MKKRAQEEAMLTFTDLAPRECIEGGPLRLHVRPGPSALTVWFNRLSLDLSPGPTGGEVGRVGFPGPLTAPAARLALSGRLKVLFRGRPGIGVIIEQVATSLDWGSAPRGTPGLLPLAQSVARAP